MRHPLHSTSPQAPQASTSPDFEAFPPWDGTNHTDRGLVRRMTESTTGGFSPLHVVPDCDDAGPGASGFNLLGQVVCILDLTDAEQRRLAKLAGMTRVAQRQRDKSLEREERMLWAVLPRLTCPGMDIDIRSDLKRTDAGRHAAIALARRLIQAECANGVGLRSSWSGGWERGNIHLDWRFDGSVAIPHLLRVMHTRVVRICAELGAPTSDNKPNGCKAWVDLAPLNHEAASRGRLWRPLGGFHKKDGERKARCV